MNFLKDPWERKSNPRYGVLGIRATNLLLEFFWKRSKKADCPLMSLRSICDRDLSTSLPAKACATVDRQHQQGCRRDEPKGWPMALMLWSLPLIEAPAL
jgi:hypothetical protein